MNLLAPTPEARKFAVESVPLGRLGEVNHIADCCLWLASPMAEYVTGAVIPVDGGQGLGGGGAFSAGFRKMLG
jgi:NAD(P)-dependent dehydrogenase (short-subunit alcohol dehydrogenase family)